MLVWAVVMAIFGLTGRAQAAPTSAPYVPTGGQNITLSRTVVGLGGAADVAAFGAVPGHNINFYIHSNEVYLATYRADSKGVASGPLTMPAGFSGQHTIVARDPLNGQSWDIPITIEGSGSTTSSSSNGSGSSSSGGLPNTGAAVMGLGVLALILLSGGATLLLLGRRRVRSTH